MSNINDGGSAFPVPDIDGGKVCEGMSLRDYFAAKVLSGIWSDSDCLATFSGSADVGLEIAKTAYEQADAMLKAREQG